MSRRPVKVWLRHDLARCTADGRCRVDLIVSWGRRESLDIWLEVSTGLVKVIRQAEA
jgi:chromosome condensin MukBEF complex kleisin-like MukF subunit